MPEITLESLAARLTAVEAQLAAQQAAGAGPAGQGLAADHRHVRRFRGHG